MNNVISKETAEIIFKEHSNYIFRIALFLTNSKELADDITQETLLQVFRKYQIYDSTKSMRPWVYKITLNTTRNMLRKHKWLKFVGKLPESSGLDLVEETVLKSEEEKELWKVINNLNFKSREIIILHFYLGMKLKEISDSLGIPLGTCKSRLNTAIITFRKQIPLNDFQLLKKGGDIIETIRY